MDKQAVSTKVSASVIDGANARRDPFRHGDLPQRPNYLPEEGDVGKSDLWAILKGLIVLIVFIGLLGLLLAR